MIDVRAIGHATFETPDVARLAEYYTHILGLNPVHLGQREAHFASVTGREVVTLKTGDASRCTSIALRVAPGEDLASAARHLDAKEGIKSERRSGITPGIADALTFQDPNGTTIELFADATPAAPAETAGIGPIKLGHIAFYCQDVQGMVDFYSRVMGFRVSDWMEDFFVFMRCGPDHHTVNFAHAKAPKLHHVAFELKDWAHVQSACELLGRKNLDILWGPGRHGIGHNIFIYHRNPDDQIIECFTELDLMLDEELGYFEPRPWHKDNPQRPKTWKSEDAALTWGPLPKPGFRNDD
ncbi:MAG: VOC family protein [Hyphomicrobiaceae bacterium]